MHILVSLVGGSHPSTIPGYFTVHLSLMQTQVKPFFQIKLKFLNCYDMQYHVILHIKRLDRFLLKYATRNIFAYAHCHFGTAKA